MTQQEAEDMGYEIDLSRCLAVAYRGERSNPDESYNLITDLEAEIASTSIEAQRLVKE